MHHSGSGTPVRLSDYPQLRQIAWQLDASTALTEQQALALYERNWRHLDPDAMPSHEKAFLDRLVATVGGGVLLV